MDQATITKLIRTAIGEPKPVTVSDAHIEEVTLEFVKMLGMKIKATDPSYYRTRTLLTSSTPVFTSPSNCMTIFKIWDLDTNAKDITGATNATPIVITCADHGYVNNEIKTIQDVGGNAAANGTWKIALDAGDPTDKFNLVGSVGDGVYVSGGKVYENPENMDEKLIAKIDLQDATSEDDRYWYFRDRNIVIDDPDFTNDILVVYEKTPSAITDIPEEYHYGGLVSGPVNSLIKLPGREMPNYESLLSSLQFHSQNWKLVNAQIERTFKLDRARIVHKRISTF